MAGNLNSGGREFELKLLLLALEPLDGQPRLPELLGQSLARRLRVNLLLFQNEGCVSNMFLNDDDTKGSEMQCRNNKYQNFQC